jgi:hypothetical protein
VHMRPHRKDAISPAAELRAIPPMNASPWFESLRVWSEMRFESVRLNQIKSAACHDLGRRSSQSRRYNT